MLNFDLFRIPVRVQVFFWLSAVYISDGFTVRNAEDWIDVLARVCVVFISIVVHELGHALTARYWGGSPAIELHGLGGVTFLGRISFTRWQHLLITVAGPIGSFLVSGVCFLLFKFTRISLEDALTFGVRINLFWAFFNLLPILPMDGGQILRDLIGPRHEKAARIIGMVAALAAGLWFYMGGNYVNAVILGIFAWLNFQGSIRTGGVQ